MSCASRGILLQQIDRLFCNGTLAGLGDGQLLERYLASGDETAFEALVQRHGPMVLGLCRRMLRDQHDIDDAFQATFLVLVRTGRSIRDRNLVSTWLYRVAFRVARQARNRSIRVRSREVQVASLEASADIEAADFREIGPALDQELNRLPEKYRAALVLCYFQGRTHDQAAQALRCPVGTVRSRLARGRDLLKKRLIGRGYASIATILGTGSNSPVSLITEFVQPSRVAATVKMALGSASANIIQVGAASTSMLALTQGVLTTMNVAQHKWIGLALLATSLSAGGAVAVSYASARTSAAATNASKGAAGSDNRSESPVFQATPAARVFLKGWGEPIDPDGDCSIDQKDGRLTIKVPGTRHGLEAETKSLNAPRVLRDIKGDFIADLKVEGTFEPTAGTNPRALPYLGAGLLLWSDAGNYIRLERAAIRRNDKLLSYFLFEERSKGRPVPPGGGIALPDGPARLRLERKGDQVTAFVRGDGENWKAFPPRTVQLPAKLKVGVAAISSATDPFIVTLEDFRVLRPE